MASNRIKLDYNNLLKYIDETLNGMNIDCEQFKLDAYSIEIGLNLLTSYIKEIAKRAIELNDDVLIGLLKDLYVLKESEDQENA